VYLRSLFSKVGSFVRSVGRIAFAYTSLCHYAVFSSSGIKGYAGILITLFAFASFFGSSIGKAHERDEKLAASFACIVHTAYDIRLMNLGLGWWWRYTWLFFPMEARSIFIVSVHYCLVVKEFAKIS
jgi:hypothetical protein